VSSTVRACRLAAALLAIAFVVPPLAAQSDPAVVAAGGERIAARAVVPEIDIYFPEGDLDLRLQRLIKNAFVQGQVRYNFVKGDILSSLQYRYYGRERIWQIGVFDELNFDRLEELSNDFQRVRGGLVQLEIPAGNNRRGFVLGEVDNLTSNKVEQLFSTDRTNTFVRVGYQIGTPDDSRSNAIVGESRTRVESLFTAHRRIGPSGFGLTGALSYSFDDLGANFSYLRAELEGLKRWPVGRTFLITRLHAGSFLDSKLIRPDEPLPQNRVAIPYDELFRLDGREALKGLDQSRRGTDEIHLTAEWFVPWFTLDTRRALGVDWDTWYWVGYVGYGNVGFDQEIFSNWGDYIVDVGAGFESSFRLGRYVLFLSGVAAEALDQEGGVKLRLTVKSSR
jgi:hypothetical protein